MRKVIVFLLTMLFVQPCLTMADTYQQLWKQAENAESKDLPRTELDILKKITNKAEAEGDYGQLIKAATRSCELWASISSDSIAKSVENIEQQAKKYEKDNPTLAAVYYAVLGSYYHSTDALGDEHEVKSKEFFAKAMSNPKLLAQSKATDFEPFVVKGRDSQVFNHDLLSLIGYMCGDYKTMHDYYKSTRNRAATVLTAVAMLRKQAEENGHINVNVLKKSRYAAQLDSLINIYSDLKACGEVALERYRHMQNCTDVTSADCYNYINWALSRWGEWPTMNELRNEQKSMTQPSFNVSTSQARFMADTPFKLSVSVRNYKTITINITKLNLDGGANYEPLSSSWLKNMAKHKIQGTTTTLTYSNVGRPEYETANDSIACKGLPVGVYMIDAWADNMKSNTQSWFLYVTDLYVADQELPDKRTRFVVLNAKTGQPVSNATLVIRGNTVAKTTLKCDAQGEVIADKSKYDWNKVRAYTSKDNAMPFCEANHDYSFNQRKQQGERARVFTDRSIYRPGQTVHASMVVYSIDGDKREAVCNKTVTMKLRNANYKIVEEKTLTTDSLGNASADFTLPTTGLTGRYSIVASTPTTATSYFRVEEYKRPTFTVELPEVNQKYQVGDTLVVTGTAKTYAGVPVQDATVKYTVRRESALWWRSTFNLSSNNDDNGLLVEQTTKTDSLGTFKMELPMVLPDWETLNSEHSKEDIRRIGRFYNITANVQVTDVAGETRTAEMCMPIGSKPTSLTVEMPSLAVRDSLKTLRFNYRNMAGRDIAGTVSYTIDGSSTVYTAVANKDTDINWNTEALLKSGSHTLKAVCGTDTLTQKFTVFSMSDTAPCTETHDWFYSSSKQFNSDGSPVYLQIGSSDNDVHVLYTALADGKLLKSGAFNLSNSVLTKQLTYREEYGDGLRLTFAWLKNGVLYTHNISLTKPQPDKRLNVKWTTFRDKTTPGAKEEWTLNITKPDGTPADASLMATLYDSSLDQIYSHSWPFSLGFSRNVPFAYWYGSRAYGCYLSYSTRLRFFTDTQLEFSKMDFEPILDMVGSRPYRKTMMARSRNSGGNDGEVLMAAASAQPKIYVRGAVTVKLDAAVSEDKVFNSLNEETVTAIRSLQGENAFGKTLSADVQMRENLNESAYFTPALRTDANGNVTMAFTLPESITTWRFMGLAHDRDMNYGSIDGETVAKKTVMIQPNMPRFVRSGDKATITARLFNTSDKAVSGTAVMQLINPETEAVVMEKTTPFKADANATSSVSFTWQASDAYQLLVCKVAAVGKTFSDGEQQYLPILPDKEMITNTMPFTQVGAGTQTVDLKSLFQKGATHKRLTVEYTNNPSWLVIQALPYIGTTSNKNIISLSTALYANTLGSHIVAKTPQLKSVFEQWKRESDGKDGSLASALTKNESLKTLVLDETPWVAEAETEAAQKRNLSTYFDTSALQGRNTGIIADMKKLQSTDGGWSWWPGMEASPYLTMTVARQLARLYKLTGSAQEFNSMLNAAVGYIGKKAVKEYEEAKKNEKKYGEGRISESFALNYLYINALLNRKPAQKEANAAQYMLTQLKKADRQTSLHTKALMAVVLAQNGEKQLAGQYLQSLEEYSVTTESMGRYYDTQRAGYSWCDYRIPTQTAAIEAMALVDSAKYSNTITEMQRWLLQQKHTQGWATPIQSADAIYAFMAGNEQSLTSQAQTVIKVDGQPVETTAATAAIGYVKANIDAQRAGTLTAEKSSAGTSWGAVYAQSMQKTTDIESSGSGLSVTKKLLNEDGTTVKTLKTGSRVKVVITVNADRAYDFVMVKDNRAACMEPAQQLSGYRNGCYCAPKDNATCYYFNRMSKGTHTIETYYYIDRAGLYETGTCTVQCAYAPEFTARAASIALKTE